MFQIIFHSYDHHLLTRVTINTGDGCSSESSSPRCGQYFITCTAHISVLNLRCQLHQYNYYGHSGSHLYSIVYFRRVAQIWNLEMECYLIVGFNSTTPHIAMLWSFLLLRRQVRGVLQFHSQAAKKDHLGLLHFVTTSVLPD